MSGITKGENKILLIRLKMSGITKGEKNLSLIDLKMNGEKFLIKEKKKKFHS
jgi:hypothetical protein